jgi:hypothetical protein
MECKQEGKIGINLNIIDKRQRGSEIPSTENSKEQHKGEVVWLCFDIYDTGLVKPGLAHYSGYTIA